MRNVAICGRLVGPLRLREERIETVEIEGVPVCCAVLHTPDPSFDPASPAHRGSALIRVRAFSCNYRDKSLILRAATVGDGDGFYVIGSELVAEVLAVGDDVTDLTPGDRVIGDNCYPEAPPGASPGIFTNHMSRERMVVPRAKLVKIPPSMSDADAASFSIGPQTAYSMVRRLCLTPGDEVLVTAARSNTSMFVIRALRNAGATVRAITSSNRDAETLLAMGLEELIVVPQGLEDLRELPRLGALWREIGGFHAVVDPFADLHLRRVVPLLRPGGRYITCGAYDQYLDIVGRDFTPVGPDLNEILGFAMYNNVSIIGNCLGTTADLEAAVADFAAGRFPPQVDSVFSDGDVAGFLDRTYNATDRLGKVVFRYAPT